MRSLDRGTQSERASTAAGSPQRAARPLHRPLQRGTHDASSDYLALGPGEPPKISYDMRRQPLDLDRAQRHPDAIVPGQQIILGAGLQASEIAALRWLN